MAARRSSDGSFDYSGIALPAETLDGRARRAALARRTAPSGVPAALVEYHSQGRLLIVGPEPYARSVAETFPEPIVCTVLAVWWPQETTAAPADDAGPDVVRAPLRSIRGHLGQFVVTVEVAGKELELAPALGRGWTHFDFVLDLARTPHLQYEVPPPGYFAPGPDQEALHRVIATIPELVGTFEKPRYFRYNPDTCAHGARGLRGCTRCLDVCPTGAIASIGERIEVDPYLCQGAGSCATACPSGAITYAYPAANELLARVRRVLHDYREAGGGGARVLYYGAETGRQWCAQMAAGLPERILPLEVEEIGSVGMEVWLATLAYGADGVELLCTPDTPASVRGEIRAQLGVGHAILEGLGYTAQRLQLLELGNTSDVVAVLGARPREPQVVPASFAPQEEKRTTLRLALAHLLHDAPAPTGAVALPSGAPFGEVRLDAAACTLCMACVAVCPASALAAGDEIPMLRFTEWNCVQCGLCEQACPEAAIVRAPRLLCDPASRHEVRTLKAEEPFRCVACGKPFATRSLMRRMQEKLAGHWMFQQPAARRRLEMCEDCRVQDMFARDGRLTDPHRGGGDQ